MTVGILCAMDEEIATLKEALQDGFTTDISGIDFYQAESAARTLF